MGSAATLKYYLDESGEPITAPGVTPPAGYSLLSTTKSPDAPKKTHSVKLLKELAESKKPITPPSGYLLQDFTSNPKGEGLYRMAQNYDSPGVAGVQEISVPYSKIKGAQGAGYKLHPDEVQRYQKDLSAEGKPVSILEKGKSAIADTFNRATQPIADVPIPEAAGLPRAEAIAVNDVNMLPNAASAFLRSAVGFKDVPAQVWETLKQINNGDPEGMKNLYSFTPTGLAGGLIDSYQNDAQQLGPNAALANLAGGLGALYAAGEVTHGAGKAVSKHVKALRDKFRPITEVPTRQRTNILHRNGAGEVRQAKGQAPTVWLSPTAWKSLVGTLYPGEDAAETHGINLPADDNLRAFANDASLAENNPAFSEVQQLLSKAHENADDGGVAVVKKRGSIQSNINVVREELNHTWQRGLANGSVNQHLDPKQFSDLYQHIPTGMYDHLIEHGYNGGNSPEIVAEAAAKLMDGRPERFGGVTNDEAIDFLDRYFKAVTDKHGADALKELHHVRGIAAEAKARAIEEHGSTGRGQDNGTVSGVAAGGQGGAAQGVQPAEGQFLTPAADTLDQRRATAQKDTLNAEDSYGQRMDDIYGKDDWEEMSEDERRDAIDQVYDEAEKEKEEEESQEKNRREQDEEVDRKVDFMDKHQSAVEDFLKEMDIPFKSKGSSVYSRYITVDLPDEERATIRISDHEPPVGRGGMREGGLDYHNEADVSIHPGSESLDGVREFLKEHGVDASFNREIPSAAGQSTDADKYVSNIGNALKEYREANTDDGILKVSLDRAREMLPGYKTPSERTANHSSLGTPALKLRDAAWDQAMADGPKGDRDIVAFLAGSPGSGKSAGEPTGENIAIISEGMIGQFDNSEHQIQRAIDAGFTPVLNFVKVDDPKVTLRRAVKRAMAHGRPVTVNVMAKLYAELPSVVEKLHNHFGDKLDISVVDNSVDGQKSKDTTLEDALSKQGAYNVDSAKEEMLDELDKLHESGQVSEPVYEAFRKGAAQKNDTLRSREDRSRRLSPSIGGAFGEDETRGSSAGNLGSKTTVIPVQGGTSLASAPHHEPVVQSHTTAPHQTTVNVSVPLQTAIPAVPVTTKRVLPLKQVMVMAAGLNPQQRQVRSVRELMAEARSRMIP